MKIAFITPFPPYRGGISKHSENIFNHLNKNHYIDIFNFKRQYPDFLFPGKTQYVKEYKSKVNSSYRTIDTINPFTWHKTADIILMGGYDTVIFRFWHPFFAPAYISICKRLKKNNNKIKLFSICDNIIPHEPFIFQEKLIHRFISYIDNVIVMSDQVKKELLSISNECSYKKLFLPILNDLGEKIQREEACKKLKIESNKINLLFFGLIRDYKGLDVFLNAISYLNVDIGNKINVIVAGECYDKNINYKKISKNSISKIYWYEKYIPDSEVNLYFSASDYVVLPYKTASQSGIIPMAYHYNLPVIISDLDSLLDNVIVNKTGFSFKNKDYKDLSKLITNIINDNSTYDFTNINEYKKKFTTKRFVNELIDTIKKND